jgi:hypothetical protein
MLSGPVTVRHDIEENQVSRFKKRVGSTLLAGAALAMIAMPALGAARIDFFAALNPVPHAATADSGSNASGQASIEYVRGTTYRVTVNATGLSPNLPHLAHIHGVVQAQNECPGPEAAGPDGLIDTLDGAPSYGPIQVTFATSGDTSAAAGLNTGTAPVSDANGNLFYQREIKLHGSIAANLSDLHIVIHGEDLNDNGTYDGQASTLGMGVPLEAELPVACGTID